MINCKISESDLEFYGFNQLQHLATVEEFASHLQDFLASSAAVIWDEEGKAELGFAKVLVDRIHGLRIEIYSKEHHPPHFHVVGGDVDACFAIDDCRHLVGNIDGMRLAKIQAWYERAKPFLIEKWNATRPTDCQVGPIR